MKKVSMKAVVRTAGALGIGLALMVLAGCTTTDFKTNEAGEFNVAPVATRDYEILGAVTLTTQDVTKVGFLKFMTSHTGSKVTYDLLLQEAKKQYPEVQELINVRIDKYDANTTTPFDGIFGYTETYTYTGHALAIKYKDAVAGGVASLTNGLGAGGKSGNAGGTGDFSIFNPLTWF